MKKFFAAIVLAVFALVGCDTGSSAGPNDDPAVESSSSVIASETKQSNSSSSVETISSSSLQGDKNSSSSGQNEASSSSLKSESTEKSSSSEKLSGASSSSAGKAKSSSSVVTLAMPCKTETEDNCEYGTLLDERDNQVYKTIQIGTQTWMAENLNYETGNSYCYKDNCTKYGRLSKYGRLYTWGAAMDSVGTWSTNGKGCGYEKKCSPTYPVRGVCPEGWHLPNQTEWNALFTAIGGQSTAGQKLKAASGWLAFSGITNEDAFGFSALPAGYSDGCWGYSNREGYTACFWSSTEHSSYDAYHMRLLYGRSDAGLSYSYYKHYGFSVRCVKD